MVVVVAVVVKQELLHVVGLEEDLMPLSALELESEETDSR
jgi:hypothetical protein